MDFPVSLLRIIMTYSNILSPFSIVLSHTKIEYSSSLESFLILVNDNSVVLVELTFRLINLHRLYYLHFTRSRCPPHIFLSIVCSSIRLTYFIYLFIGIKLQIIIITSSGIHTVYSMQCKSPESLVRIETK